MDCVKFCAILTSIAGITFAQSAGSFTTLTASGTTTLTGGGVPSTTPGSGALQIINSRHKIEFGAPYIQSYIGNTVGQLDINSDGGEIIMYASPSAIYFSGIGGPNNDACQSINSNPQGGCGGYNFYVNGQAGVGGNLRVTGNDTVGGNLYALGSIYVGTSGWSISAPDYVFASGYKLAPLSDVESYVQEHHHLPGIASASDQEKSGAIDMVKFNQDLLKKVEELTLYVIDQNKKIEELQQASAKGR